MPNREASWVNFAGFGAQLGREVRKFFKELFDSRGLSKHQHLSLSGPSVLEGVKDTVRSKHDGASRGAQMGVSHGGFVAAFENEFRPHGRDDAGAALRRAASSPPSV